MSKDVSFLDQLMAGLVMSDQIDDFVDHWHEGATGQPIHQFLGMTAEEYSLWVQDPDALATIARARRYEISLAQAVNDNTSELKMAARSGDGLKLKRLQAWLASRGAPSNDVG
jgi:hypothetical protein